MDRDTVRCQGDTGRRRKRVRRGVRASGVRLFVLPHRIAEAQRPRRARTAHSHRGVLRTIRRRPHGRVAQPCTTAVGEGLQGLRGVGRAPRRHCDRHRGPRPAAAPQPPPQHPRRELQAQRQATGRSADLASTAQRIARRQDSTKSEVGCVKSKPALTPLARRDVRSDLVVGLPVPLRQHLPLKLFMQPSSTVTQARGRLGSRSPKPLTHGPGRELRFVVQAYVIRHPSGQHPQIQNEADTTERLPFINSGAQETSLGTVHQRRRTRGHMDASDPVRYIVGSGTPARTRTGAHGLGNRCSIHLSYRGVNAGRPNDRPRNSSRP